jgi:hypothetical protein
VVVSRSCLAFLVAVSVALGSVSRAAAQSSPSPDARLYIEAPVLDMPWLFEGGPVPSMQQSLWAATDLYELMHFGIGRLDAAPDAPLWRRVAAKTLILGADVATLSLPGFAGWQHEEWHRAVMAQHGIGSHNGIYDLQLFAGPVAVSRVDDADLARLKRDHPADMVRLTAAGLEANYELATQLHRVQFFQGTRNWHTGAIALLYYANISYIAGCASTGFDAEIDRINEEEGADVGKRDFAGPDCTTWVYDLFRHDEPYEARGVHPSGAGVDRYRKFADLAPEEQRYLKAQRNLSLLNVFDPALLGIVRFPGGQLGDGRAWDFSANVRHELTPFGYDVSLQGFWRLAPVGVFARFHGYANHDRFFPGLDVELVRLPVGIAGVPASLSARGAVWLQPSEQRFFGKDTQVGGLAGARLALDAWLVAPYLELEAKSAGWVPGNPYLDRAVTIRLGAALSLR